MLGIRGVAHGGGAYYLSDLARELPVAEPGRWVGTAAGGLGLEGVVDPTGLHRLLDGQTPALLPLSRARTSVAAFDLTFSAPKSVSVAFGLAGEDGARQVVAAHLDAVEGALHYLERHAVSAVRRSGTDRTVIPTTGIIGARFTHGVNRNGDPHLHSHVLMANLVHGDDGRWSACDRRGLDAHRRAAGAVYEAGLRDGLTRGLGVGWTRPLGRSAEIVGVSGALLGEFSSRSADIRRHLFETGARSRRGHFVAWAATRAEKDPMTFADAARDWARRAGAVGSATLALGSDRPPGERNAVLDEHAFAAVVSQTPHSGVHRRDAVAAFAGAAPDGTTVTTLEHVVGRWVPDPEGSLGVAEPVHSRRSVVPANHLLHALGPRPLDPGDHDVWVGAARALDDYRGRWGLERSPDPLGLDRGALSTLPTARLADHLRVSRHLEEARARLGCRQPAELELGLSPGR